MRPLFLLVCLACLALAAPAREPARVPVQENGPAQDEKPPLERDGVLFLTLPETRGARMEYFRLDAPSPSPNAEPGEAETALGIASLYRAPGENGGVRLELSMRYFEPYVSVHLVERLEHDSINLVWRELGDRGRTVHVSWDLAQDTATARDAGGAAIRKREIDAKEGLLTPLYMLEQLRTRRLSDGGFRRLAPSSCAAEVLTLREEPAFPGVLPGLRFATWRRADGSLAGRYLLRGKSILGFQLQRGGPVARRIDADEHSLLDRAHRRPLAMR